MTIPLQSLNAEQASNDLSGIKRILRSFVSRVPGAKFDFKPSNVDDLTAAVVSELKRMDLDLTLVKPWLKWACQIAEDFYVFHDFDLKVLISICTLVFFFIDDSLSRTPEVLYRFQTSLLAGKPQENPVLECLVKHLLPRMEDYYGPLSSNAIALSFYDYIMGTTMESLTKTLALHPRAPQYPEYVRLKSGAAAQYSYFLFPRSKHPNVDKYIQVIPDLMAVLDRANDILSFYKEEIAGEDDNYVHMRAMVAGTDIETALDTICDETVEMIDNITATLAEHPAEAGAFQAMVEGYFHFHFAASRYKLEPLFTQKD